MATSSIFSQKKAKILGLLAVPETEYSDLSPKGSVDAGIRDLIDEINALDGVVTTSSCAGRVSVYLEGHKALKKGQKSQPSHSVSSSNSTPNGDENVDDIANERNPSSSAGGKGGGQWLFVSHDPLPESPSMVTSEGVDGKNESWSTVFGLEESSNSEKEGGTQKKEVGSQPRLIHFKFEPMVSCLLRPFFIYLLLFNKGPSRSSTSSQHPTSSPNWWYKPAWKLDSARPAQSACYQDTNPKKK